MNASFFSVELGKHLYGRSIYMAYWVFFNRFIIYYWFYNYYFANYLFGIYIFFNFILKLVRNWTISNISFINIFYY